jgi:hypothetical protein
MRQTIPTLIQYNATNYRLSNKERERKGIQIGKEEVKVFLFLDE